eukprot:gene5514-6868_t
MGTLYQHHLKYPNLFLRKRLQLTRQFFLEYSRQHQQQYEQDEDGELQSILDLQSPGIESFLSEHLVTLIIRINMDIYDFFIGVLPKLKSLKSLNMHIETECRLPSNSIPDSVTSLGITLSDGLLFNNWIGNVLEPGTIPDSVIKLLLEYQLYKHNNNPSLIIPDSVTDLDFCGWSFNMDDLNLNLSSFVKILRLNSKLITPPVSEEPQIFRPGYLPMTIKELIFVNLFKNKLIFVHNIIPNGVTTLEFGDYNYSPIEAGVIPSSVLKLDFGSTYNHPIKNPFIIPGGVKGLCNSTYSICNLDTLPHELLILDISESKLDSTKLPRNIECCFDTIPTGFLPSSLRILYLVREVNRIDIGAIPSTVNTIVFSRTVKCPILQGTLPNSLENLFIFESSSKLPFPHLPELLQKLTLGSEFEHLIPPGSLPD